MPITDNWLSEQSTCFDTCVTSGYSKPGGVSSKTMTAPLSVAFESAERAIRVVEYYCPDHLISLFRRSCRSFSSFHYPPPPFLVLSFLSYSNDIQNNIISLTRRDYTSFSSNFSSFLCTSCHHFRKERREEGNRTNPKNLRSLDFPRLRIPTTIRSVRIFPGGGRKEKIGGRGDET